MKLDILKYTNPILRKKAKAVKRVDHKILKLLDDMVETMDAAPGIGLAANQVGEGVRVIVAKVEDNLIELINPKIIKKSGEQGILEGCLSLPGIQGPVKRAQKVTVEGLNRSNKKVKIEAGGLLATVLQHEIDHIDGKLFIDRVADPSLIKFIPPEEEKKEELI